MNKSWAELKERGRKLLWPYRYALAVVALGVVFLLLPTAREENQSVEAAQSGSEEDFDLAEFQRQLEDILSQISGAGKTSVLLTVDRSSRQVLAQDVDKGSGGDSTSTILTIGKGSGTQAVVPLQVIAPSFRGAVVVCSGGNDPQVRLKLVEAVSALTGLGADRISICQGEP
jgi:stage III sporulation protein AG